MTIKLCCMNFCNNKVLAGKLCSKHYQQDRKPQIKKKPKSKKIPNSDLKVIKRAHREVFMDCGEYTNEYL